MKPDTERKKRFNAKLHKKKDFLNVHLSKELRKKMKVKKRALLIHKGDKVKIMRGFAASRTGTVAKVNYRSARVYVEAVTKRTARGKEVLIPLQPSNLLLVDPLMNDNRKKLFGTEQAVKKQDADAVSSQEKVKVESPKVVSEQSAVGRQQPATG